MVEKIYFYQNLQIKEMNKMGNDPVSFAAFMGIYFLGLFAFGSLLYDISYDIENKWHGEDILNSEEQKIMYDYYFNYRQDLSDGDINTEEFIEKYFYIDDSVNGDFEGVDFEESVEMYQVFSSFSPSDLIVTSPDGQFSLIPLQSHTNSPIAKPNFTYNLHFQVEEGPFYIYPEDYEESEPYNGIIDGLKRLPGDISTIINRDPDFEFAGKLPEFIDAICYLPYYTGEIDSEGNLIYDKYDVHHDYLIIIDGEIYSHVVWKERFDIKVFPNDIGLLHGW
jgi:hypothetical protein